MTRQKKLLAVLSGLFVLALVYAFWATPRPREIATTVEPSPPRAPAPESPSEIETPVEGTRVRLDLLTQDRERFAGYQRDIFNYPRVAPPPAPRVAKPPAPPPPPAAAEPAPVPEEVERELARFTFLGFLEKENVKTIFLSSEGEIFLVKEGKNFGEENEFRVAELTPERLVIRHRDDPRIITVPLVEQAPLVPSGPARPMPPFSRPEAGPVFPDRDGEDLLPPEEAPVFEEESLEPPAEGENGFPPAGEGGEAPPDEGGGPPAEEGNDVLRGEEEGMTGNDMSPPGGAADE